MKNSLFTCVILLITAFAWSQLIVAPRSQNFTGHASARSSSPSAQEIWSNLMEGNGRFVAGRSEARDLTKLRNSLANSQRPNAIVLACSDSRVAPELLFDQTLGDLFVVRSAGNIADAIGVGSIEYAVEHLGSSILVVLGHTKCGAVTAACSREKMPSPGLQSIVDKIEPAVAKASKSAKADELVEAAIRQNIHQSAADILANSEILRHFVEDGKLTIFEAEYQLDTGKVIRLNNARP
jgi:carbonic anhydrase